MPIIADHHSWKDADYSPTCPWPDTTTVQWGGSGVVISKAGNYGTAFFEAFPGEDEGAGGFIRGEGPTIADAERSAFAKFSKERRCAHAWARGKYTNGGTICRRCGAFKTTMQPVAKLGHCRRPIDAHDVMMWSMEQEMGNWPLPPAEEKKSRRFARERYLRFKLFGFDSAEARARALRDGLIDQDGQLLFPVPPK